jgi:hypothetical protein
MAHFGHKAYRHESNIVEKSIFFRMNFTLAIADTLEATIDV